MREMIVTVGPSASGRSSDMVRFDDYAPGLVSIQCSATGTVSYTIQSSLDDPNIQINNPSSGPMPPPAISVTGMTWVSSNDPAAVGATGSIQSNFAFAPKFARILVNSGTGTVTATFLQHSSTP